MFTGIGSSISTSRETITARISYVIGEELGISFDKNTYNSWQGVRQWLGEVRAKMTEAFGKEAMVIRGFGGNDTIDIYNVTFLDGTNVLVGFKR